MKIQTKIFLTLSFLLFFLHSHQSCANTVLTNEYQTLEVKNQKHFSTTDEWLPDLVESLLPTVVNISILHKPNNDSSSSNLYYFPGGDILKEFRDFFERSDPFGGGKQNKSPSSSLGSGVIINSSGVILTSAHLIGNYQEINITTLDGKKYAAEVVGLDAETDVAVLKINSDTPLPYANMGSSDDLRVAQTTIAIGNPFGLGSTVTLGVISATNRDINSSRVEFIQTDAAINQGNSGGPLFNKNGEVIGTNSSIYTITGGNLGIGFAIPIDISKPIIEMLIRDGKVMHGWLGITMQEVTEEISKSLDQERPFGIIVSQTIKGSPAEKAGLKIGDVILKINDITIENPRHVQKLVYKMNVGDKIKLTILRNGTKKNISLTIDQKSVRDDLDQYSHEVYDLNGIEVIDISENLRHKLNINDTKGVLVQSAPNSKFLKRGDIIFNAANSEIDSVKKLKSVVESEKKKGSNSILLWINRSGINIFTAISL